MLCNYTPSVFDVTNISAAKRIILTDEDNACSEERWLTETPRLVGLMSSMGLNESSVVLDYGCGIGRLSKALIHRYGCRVIGADISRNMRALAAEYVDSDRFASCAPDMLAFLGARYDAAITVWVLQHCCNPADDLARIRSLVNPGAGLFVVNEHFRCVPTNIGWVDDMQDIRPMISIGFKQIDAGELDMTSGRKERPYWARYVAT